MALIKVASLALCVWTGSRVELRQRTLWAVISGAGFALLEGLLGLIHPAQGVAYKLLDLPISLFGWTVLAAILALPKQGERLASAVLLALVLPVLLGSPWWGLLGLVGFAIPKVGLPAFAALGLLSAWLHPREPSPQATHLELPGLMLITVDTLRFDHARELMDQLPVQAVSAAPWTLPAMDSLMLGVSAVEHGGGREGETGVTRPTGTRLAERLKEQGYVSSAWVCNPHLRAEVGFDRGFESFVHSDTWRDPMLLRFLVQDRMQRWTGEIPYMWRERDRALVDLARQDVEQGMEGRFVWLHIFGPHEYLRDPVQVGADTAALYGLAVERSGQDLAGLLQAVPSGTRVLLMSDHGESLGEGGLWGHGTDLSDAQLLVPAWVMGMSLPMVEGPVFAWHLPGAVFEGQALVSPPQAPVTGVRGDPQRAALRSASGYQALDLSQGMVLDELDLSHLKGQLEALGYIGEPSD